MLTPQALQKVSSAFRKGYYAGYAGEEDSNSTIVTPFSEFDYREGYKAGANDAHWARQQRSKRGGK
jgi:hypothetical protein